MLLEFSVSNYRSIKKLETLSLVAAPIVSKNKELDELNTFLAPTKDRLLKSVAIYGANGSGKSNIIKAFLTMLYFIRDSFADEEKTRKVYDPFLLDDKTVKKPTYFQLVFIFNKSQYRFGFELQRDKVVSEWLFGPAQKNEVFYYQRENGMINVNATSFPEGVGLEKNKTKDTTLFLNVAHAFNGKISTSIKDFFRTELILSMGINDEAFKGSAIQLLKDKHNYEQVIHLLGDADFGISGIEEIELDLGRETTKADKGMEKKERKGVLVAERTILNSKGGIKKRFHVPFEFFESEGTKKFFIHAGMIIKALETGKTVFIDEFDSRLHPMLTRKIVQMFNSKMVNKKNAQLIFVTHDTNLLDASLMRRDQIYFVEKKKNGESHFYSLINVRGVRNDASYGKDYVKGKYGAVPYLGNFNID